MNTRGAEVFWRPRDPGSGGGKVQFRDSELTACLLDKKPLILAERETVEDPACFWIDHEHVYLRINWAKWAAVSLDNPELADALCRSRHCRVSTALNKGCIAPVYHVAALPEELFGPARGRGAPASRVEDQYRQCLLTLLEAVESLPRNVGVYEHVKLGDDMPTFVVKDDRRTLILDVLPDNLTPIDFTSAGGGKNHRLMDEWETGLISLDFIEGLRRMRQFLAGTEPDSAVRAGFLADTLTVAVLLTLREPEEIADIKLLTYKNLKSDLRAFFAPENS